MAEPLWEALTSAERALMIFAGEAWGILPYAEADLDEDGDAADFPGAVLSLVDRGWVQLHRLPESLHYRPGVHALGEQQAGAGVAEIVNADPADLGIAAQDGQHPIETPRIRRPTGGCGEDQTIGLVCQGRPLVARYRALLRLTRLVKR